MADTHPAALPPAKPIAPAEAPDASKAMTLFVMVVATLYFGKEVLVPVTLALLLAFVLAPLVALLRRAHLGRVPSVLLGVIVALGVVLAIGGVIGTQIAQLTTDLPRYAQTVETKVSTVRDFTVGRLSQLADRIGPQTGTTATAPNAAPPVLGPSSWPSATAPSAAQPSGSTPFDLARRYLSPVLSPLATFGIVFVVAVFALLQREDLRDRLIRLVGSDDLHRTTVAIDDGGRRLSKYFLTQLIINTMFGIVIGLGLLVIGVPNPVLWGILSALLRFVPYVGSFISAVLPMGLAAAVEPGWSMVLWTAGLYVVVEGVTGQVIEPMMYGHSTGLSPFSVVVAAIFWSWLWGPIGLILSTPLTLCLVVMGRHVKRLEFLDVMLGDRPALTPVESFYQRILAGDADEAQDHAESLLKERSLSTYYDEVALKGLQLAANDSQRGVLDHEQLDRVKNTIKVVVRGLQGHDDKQTSDDGAVGQPGNERDLPRNPDPQGVSSTRDELPEAWQGEAAVLCIAGRGPLDEAASAMLVQLLGKHGMGGRLVGYDEVSRERIETLDVTQATMACISYLDISGSPAHLRYLMQRLRQRLPHGTPILVGMWPSEDATLKDKSVQAAIGADYFTSSLEQAVTTCSEAACKAGGRATAPGKPGPIGESTARPAPGSLTSTRPARIILSPSPAVRARAFNLKDLVMDTTPPRSPLPTGQPGSAHTATDNLLLACSAEVIGTFLLVLVGTAVATAAVLGKNTAGPAYDSLAVALSFGLILIPIVGSLGQVSGAHVNPSVTLGLAVAGKFPWRYVAPYWVSQMVGAIVAALVVWAAYGHGAYFDAHLGAPSPANGADLLQVLLVEALIAFILVFTVISTATDPRVPAGTASVAIGFALAAGVLLGGPVSGGAGNPARALGPMIVSGTFPVWFFYTVGPLIGAIVAAVAFRLVGMANTPKVQG